MCLMLQRGRVVLEIGGESAIRKSAIFFAKAGDCPLGRLSTTHPRVFTTPEIRGIPPLYALVEDHFDHFERIYDDTYQQEYGFWRPVIREVVDTYLDCGNLHCGFARVRCGSCAHEYVLAFSCKGRYFCPSCHQKRVLQFAECVSQEVLQPVPHSQYVFTIPKMLRPYFKSDRRLLGVLSQCAWEILRAYFQAALPETQARPGVILSIQTYGRTCHYHPHLHLLVSDGIFDSQGAFYPVPFVDTRQLEALFRHKVLHRLVAQD